MTLHRVLSLPASGASECQAPGPSRAAHDAPRRWAADASALVLRVLRDEVDRRGRDPEPLLAELGLRRRDVDSPLGRVARDAVFTFAERAAALVGDPWLHLAAAAHADIGAFGALDFVATMAPTVGLGLSRAAAGFAVIDAGLSVEPVVATREAHLRLVAIHEPRPHPVEVEMLAVATAVRIRRATDGRHGPRLVALSGPDRGQRPALEALVGCPVACGEAEDRLVFDRTSWDARSTTAHPAFRAILALAAEPLLDALAPIAGTVASVERVVEERLEDGGLSAAQVAIVLDLSTRTLHRRLAREGRSFGDIVDAVRLRVARRELAAGTPICEISLRLGFSEATAFTRAYRRWTGAPPSHHRAQIGA
ncbi:MAG: AraC family transcriptional regulator ligand-binding domain-containing protein [Deltaproteobacteria bacterium]|nr:AraC family transcriptional regulator ligand-binding domain-containing protein [Deltaproteobacteria bacterium]